MDYAIVNLTPYKNRWLRWTTMRRSGRGQQHIGIELELLQIVDDFGNAFFTPFFGTTDDFGDYLEST